MQTQNTLRSVRQLIDQGLARPAEAAVLEQVAQQFAVAITPALVRAIDTQDPGDPLRAQFVPSADELKWLDGELADPIADHAHSPLPGLVHRYPDRVLLKPLLVCPVYCRFCFRREMVGTGAEPLSEAALDQALDYVETHTDIWEVIVSGGDPLVLSPQRLRRITERLERMAHIGSVRFHTRVPVVKPEAIDAEKVAALKSSKATYVILHTNHASELSAAARAACARLIDAGVPMLSQTVLLKGVNADPATLEQLFRALVAMRIKPYYLHHGDLARGTAHFRTSIEEGQRIVGALRGVMSGLCQPSYVLDLPGGHGKVPIGPNYLRATGAGDYTVLDYRGQSHHYQDWLGETGRR
jgi:lysine 2,3-aminomutase